ncbi:hypothetical protein [Sediminicola sp. 1XM1-17]|uniref:hypothetical protein n=1 Tax=Sediminicola sp. 1XM1-17 TaxID=3127702 RepID=UPI0030777F6A
MCCGIAFSQSVNFDQLGKEKFLRYNGGFAANAVYYDGAANRQALTYYLTGNLNFNIAGLYNVPLSFTYSNQEFDFPNPFKFNRFSFNPSYKWVAAHLGDVAMTFSPYTLSGHQFTGAGIDLTPEGPFQISAMYGRFLRSTEYNPEAPEALTAYQRMGFGLKTSYDFEIAKLGIIFFKAKDDENSLENPIPIELGLTPKENTVVSFESEFQLFEKAQIRIEYAISGVTEDNRLTEERTEKGLLSFVLNENLSTNYYNALNASFNYPAGNGSLGAGYERIDPDYKTFGAYFFNNDLENITVNANQTIFDGKVNLSVNAGVQQDNLDKAKSSDQQRIVTSINVNYTASDRLGLNGSYSNFQSYTNIRDQFDYINQVNQFDNVDTLNYRQISQNANLGINYILKQTETKQHTTNLNLVYQNSNNQQEGETIEGGLSTFYNGMAAYTLGYPKEALSISLAANTSYNTIGVDKNLTLGPTMAVGKQFFDKKLRTNLSSSYNTSFKNGEQQGSVYNFRMGGNYVWLQKHNFSLNVLTLFRNATTANTTDVTITFGYSYTFDNFKLNLDLRGRNANANTISFRYRNVVYSGTIPNINNQLSTVFGSSQFAAIPTFKKDELVLLLAIVKKQDKDETYKDYALSFLAALYDYGDFQPVYNAALFSTIQKIKRDMRKMDVVLEQLFVDQKLKVDQHPIHNIEITSLEDQELEKAYKILVQDQQIRLERLVGHRWMQQQFSEFVDMEVVAQPTGDLKEFKETMAPRAYKDFDVNADMERLEELLENEIIDFYYKKSLRTVNPETFELKYINKN